MLHARVIVPVGVVVAVAVVVGVRDLGYLGGRDEDGPLAGEGGGGTVFRPIGTRYTFNDTHIRTMSDKPLAIETMRVVRKSPGLQILGIRIMPFSDDQAGYRGFPPRKATLRSDGARLPPGKTWTISIGIQRTADGVQSFEDLRVRYRSGSRRFDEVLRTNGAVASGPPRD